MICKNLTLDFGTSTRVLHFLLESIKSWVTKIINVNYPCGNAGEANVPIAKKAKNFIFISQDFLNCNSVDAFLLIKSRKLYLSKC